MKLLLLRLLFLSGVVLVNAENCFAQTQSTSTDQYQKVTNYMSEVFLNCPQYIDSFHINNGIEFLTRLQVHTVDANLYPECLLLSSVHLKNKCNPNLTYDGLNFNIDTFNPFKYNFSFYSTQTAYFRVDGTNYIIEIKPYK
jgi:hypothetical protein